MADALVSTVLQQLSSILEQEIRQEVRLVVGVTKDVKNLSSTFTKVQAVIEDAEERQVNNKPVRVWLEDLKHVAYDMDDLLDEWRTKIILKSQKQERVNAVPTIYLMINKVCTTTYLLSPCFCFKQLGFRHKIGSRIKEIKERLDEIATDKDRYHLTQASSSSDRRKGESTKTPQTSSLVDVSEIFGRNLDKDVIVSKLVSESSQAEIMDPPVSIISVVGMGGLGKTTLAQLAYNDEKVMNHFQKRVWVCVSEPFDKVRIAKEIIKAVGDENIVDADGTSWDALHGQLSKSIDGKHFLLVLDDVWTEDHTEWHPLKLSFSRGAKGSRIVVTTRNEKVAIMMRTTYIHHLGTLSKADCWSLIRSVAFAGRREEECVELKEIGMEIAEKCKGLPISAKTIGSLLLFKPTRQDWQLVLASDTWEISDVENKVLPALLLSYYNLPSHLKRCFEYCAIFPKDTRIGRYYLIGHWMAHGILINSSMAKNKELEFIGEEYYDNLVMRSFFQKIDTDISGKIIYCKMHDLVHDFAQFLTRSECFIMNINKNNNDQLLNYSKARHLNVVLEHKEIGNNIPPSIYQAKNLRTLIVRCESVLSVSPDLFHHLKFLRVLDLYGTGVEELPSEVGKLIHLRYLDLSHSRLKELPTTVSNLYNLEKLRLYWCRCLRKLPEGIGRLVNLRNLEIYESRQLSYLPQGIGRLSSLRYLSDFIVGGGSVDGEGCKIGELKDLNLLQRELRIIGLERVADGNEAKEADLKKKEHLSYLSLHFDKYTGIALIADGVIEEEEEEDDDDDNDNDNDGDGDGISEDRDGDGDGDGNGDNDDDDGGQTPKRMEDVLESLQPHPNLQKLEIHDYLGTKFPNWMMRDNDSMLLSNLVYLELMDWKNCKQLPPILGKLSSLQKLCIDGMHKVKYMGCEFFGIDGGGAAISDGVVKTVFPKLKALQISDMYNLKEWNMRVGEEDGREINFMPNLGYLVIVGCLKLKMLPHHLLHSTSLRKLLICNCPKLSWTPSSTFSSTCNLLLPHLKELELQWNAGEFSKSLSPKSSYTYFPRLKSLTIKKSPYKSLPEGLGKLTALQSLHIKRSRTSKSMPEELKSLSTLQKLTIDKCGALGPRCQKEEGEDWSKISHIPNIQIDGKKIQ